MRLLRLHRRPCVLRQAQDEVERAWHLQMQHEKVPHPEPVEGRNDIDAERLHPRAKRTASSAALNRARALSRISWCSAAGSLSATTPQPACTTISPSLTTAVRSTMQVSMLPSPAKYPTAPP